MEDFVQSPQQKYKFSEKNYFRTEPPSLFRGRGEHPKQGMVKRRIVPEDVIINCSKVSFLFRITLFREHKFPRFQ